MMSKMFRVFCSLAYIVAYSERVKYIHKASLSKEERIARIAHVMPNHITNVQWNGTVNFNLSNSRYLNF